MMEKNNMTMLKNYSRDILPNVQVCTPCISGGTQAGDYDGLQMKLSRALLPGSGGERLTISISNPHNDKAFRQVRIAFLNADQNPYMDDAEAGISFSPAHGIEFGDIGVAADSVVSREIIVQDRLKQPHCCHFYAGVCFTSAPRNRPQEAQSGYVLFKSELSCRTVSA
jgi:hypothetical protein